MQLFYSTCMNNQTLCEPRLIVRTLSYLNKKQNGHKLEAVKQGTPESLHTSETKTIWYSWGAGAGTGIEYMG